MKFVHKQNTQLPDGTLENLLYPPSEYKYFRDAQPSRVDGELDLVRMAWAADAAMLAYARRGPSRMDPPQFDDNLARGKMKLLGRIGNWQGSGTQGYFAGNDEYAFLSFRGTEVDDWQDVIDDLNCILRPEPASQVNGTQVHQGFQKALDRVWNQVEQLFSTYRKNHPSAPIHFTGHSLGAALATLAYSRLGDENSWLITFGSPRVGNDQFCQKVMAVPGHVMRIVNHEDPVAHLPPDLMGYCHAPVVPWVIDANGDMANVPGVNLANCDEFKKFVLSVPMLVLSGLRGLAPSWLVDHSPGRYAIRMWDLV